MFRRFYHSNQLRVVFEWLSGIAHESDVILVRKSGHDKLFRFRFPLCPGDMPHCEKAKREEVTFIVCVRTVEPSPLDQKWIRIFFSPEIEIWENKNRTAGPAPLRWGLDNDEKKFSIKLARKALTKFLTSDEQLSYAELQNIRLPIRFQLKTDLDVALWVHGQLRGSMVVEQLPLAEAIVTAASYVSRDMRFKPVTTDELPFTRIEITLISGLRIPLTDEEQKIDVIYSEKGYLYIKGNRRGWFLPEVFNVRRYETLQKFLNDLAKEKAGIIGDRAGAQILIFEVDDFIETENQQDVLTLKGPIVSYEKDVSITELETHSRAWADWLCRIQEPDGNFPPDMNPLTSRHTQIDWPRLAFTAWTLAEFGKIMKDGKYIRAAEKSFWYLKQFLISSFPILVPSHELALVYFGQLSLALNKPNEAGVVAHRILSRVNTLNFEPITFAQIASFFKIISKKDREFSAPFEYLTRIIKENFEQSLKGDKSMNLAVWAESVNTFTGVDEEFSCKVANWLKTQQLSSGAFPESTYSNFVYTRGTGKIFEVLVIDVGANNDSIQQAIRWLVSMNYNQGNTFFIPEESRIRFIGGFRHDYFNHETWIDAVGHVLLGTTRLLKSQTE